MQRVLVGADLTRAVDEWMSDNRPGLAYDHVEPAGDLAVGVRLERANLPRRMPDGAPAPDAVVAVGVGRTDGPARDLGAPWVGLRLVGTDDDTGSLCAAYRSRLVVMHPFFRAWNDVEAPWVAWRHVDGGTRDTNRTEDVVRALTTLVYALTIHLPSAEVSSPEV